jgi:hypothetical protein
MNKNQVHFSSKIKLQNPSIKETYKFSEHLDSINHKPENLENKTNKLPILKFRLSKTRSQDYLKETDNKIINFKTNNPVNQSSNNK